MIYLKEPITNRIIQFQNEASIGAGFSGWTTLTESETLAYELQEAKTSKLAQLDKNRNDFCLIPIEFEGNTYATTINAWAAISYLANGLATLSTEAPYPNLGGDNITLTKADFKAIAALIQTREMASRDFRRSKIDEINAIVIDGQYFDDQDQPITPIQAVNLISTTFE
jgi:hypothetical protein